MSAQVISFLTSENLGTHTPTGWLALRINRVVGRDYELCAGVAPLGTDGRVSHRYRGTGCLFLRDLPALQCRG